MNVVKLHQQGEKTQREETRHVTLIKQKQQKETRWKNRITTAVMILLTLSDFYISAIIFEHSSKIVVWLWHLYFLEDKADHVCTHRPLEAETQSHTATQTFGVTWECSCFWKRTWFLFTSNIKLHQMTTNNKVGILTQLEKGFCCQPRLSLYNWDPSSPRTRWRFNNDINVLFTALIHLYHPVSFC